jgi:hypothetical protein
MLNNILNLIRKSHTSNNLLQRNIVVNTNGEILSKNKLTDLEHIRVNATVATILKKQISIINQCSLVIKEKIEGLDVKSNNIVANKFLNWLNNPNCRPYPTNQAQIIENIIKQYTYYGNSAIVFVFDKEIGINNFKHIKIVKNLKLISYNENKVEYEASFNNHYNYTFKYDGVRQNYVANDENNNKMVLCLFENFDFENNCYAGSFEGVIEYIKLQNSLSEFARSFHSNSCMPSSIITITTLDKKGALDLTAHEKENFESLISNLREQMINASANGKAIIVNKPNMNIEIKPIQLPTNATDNISFHDLCSQKIYAFNDGGNRSAFEGLNEYSNNAEIKLVDLYHGTIRVANNIILNSLDKFFRDLFKNRIIFQEASNVKIPNINTKDLLNIENMYFQFDISNVKVFQKDTLLEIIQLWKDNLITLEQANEFLKQINDKYSGITVDKGLKNKYYFDFEKQKQNNSII